MWVIVYEPVFGKAEEKINCLKLASLPLIREEWKEVINYFKKSLSSDNPAVGIYNNIYTTELPSLTQSYKNVTKSKVKSSPDENYLDDYIKPYDIIKVNRKGGVYQHVAIYLGSKRIAHISKEKNENSPRDFRARIDTWKNFLRGSQEIEIHHPFIPFKRPELIQKHIDIAVKSKYGWGKYHLLKDNCEHFATMCVYGLGISQQRSINTINKATKGSEYLLQAIQKSNEFFDNLVEDYKRNWTQKINNLKWDLGMAPELLKEGINWESKLNSKKVINEIEEHAKEILRNIYQIAQREIPVDLQKFETNIQIPPK